MLRVTASDRSDDIGQTRPGGYQREGSLTVAGTLVKMFGADARRNLMHDGNAFKAVPDAVEQVHDAAARHKETVCIAKLDQPLPKKV
jgi:hypothetical protein